MPKVEYIIAAGMVMGGIARFYYLRVDYRQYPSYPQGYTIHLTLGMIAAGLGAVAIPALLNKEYAAITFVALAVQQFREVRNMERESLERVEQNEMVKRGQAYIEDIAKKFEARNYVSMITALVTTLAVYLTRSIMAGIIAGLAVIISMKFLIRLRKVGDIAHVKAARIRFEGPLMLVDDIIMMNVGLKQARKKYMEEAIAAMITPKDDNARVTLTNTGQRQAMLHDITAILGIRRETDEPEFIPMAKRNSDDGRIGIVAITMEPDIECMLEIIKRVPVLETSKRHPLDSYIGRKAAD